MSNEPRNHGKLWKRHEKRNLIRLFNEGVALKDLAQQFERKETAVQRMINIIEIEKIIKRREIKRLVHFTDIQNLDSIKKYGILNVNYLRHKTNIDFDYNDSKRLDNMLGHISTSISSINQFLFKKFKSQYKKKKYLVIEIDPSIMANGEASFFEYNAAHHALRPKNPEDWIERQKSKYLEGMFAENVMGHSRNEKQEKWEPTRVQAEVMLKEIPRSKIVSWKEIDDN